MKVIHKLITGVSLVTTRPLFWLSCLMPRDKQLWVFSGWHRGHDGEIFADNTKYFFLYLHQNQKEIRSVWLAKDRKLAATLHSAGYEAYYEYSLMGTWLALRAGFTVIDAYLQPENFRLSGRSKIIQLLHGKGMKEQGYNDAPIRPNNYIFNTSPLTLSLLPDIFKRGSRNYITGYSRTDIFWQSLAGSDISTSQMVNRRLREIKKSEPEAVCFWYTPTFRRGHKTFPLETVLAPNDINNWLEQNNSYLFVSLHPKYRDQIRAYTYSRIIFFDESDVYPLMKEFDCLISDYSSIFTDYLLLDRPIIFYPYDLADYTKHEGLNIDYMTLPGPKVFTVEELLSAMTTIKSGQDSHQSERATTRNLYHTYQDGKASERILAIINQDESLGLSV